MYSNQVFITDSVENIVPEFLTLLHGVIDSVQEEDPLAVPLEDRGANVLERREEGAPASMAVSVMALQKQGLSN